jgi:hypothetical protein
MLIGGQRPRISGGVLIPAPHKADQDSRHNDDFPDCHGFAEPGDSSCFP